MVIKIAKEEFYNFFLNIIYDMFIKHGYNLDNWLIRNKENLKIQPKIVLRSHISKLLILDIIKFQPQQSTDNININGQLMFQLEFCNIQYTKVELFDGGLKFHLCCANFFVVICNKNIFQLNVSLHLIFKNTIFANCFH